MKTFRLFELQALNELAKKKFISKPINIIIKNDRIIISNEGYIPLELLKYSAQFFEDGLGLEINKKGIGAIVDFFDRPRFYAIINYRLSDNTEVPIINFY